ncbi:MAG: hypothetical protein GF346_06875 [Candidatus Eisenbacteria bacterium]|nr:hypothetical protein [Candidatus Latescibacterota bacterium]MBD3302152.1 hypothetical protein [Candidatus Eisenbacteria bacterium]
MAARRTTPEARGCQADRVSTEDLMIRKAPLCSSFLALLAAFPGIALASSSSEFVLEEDQVIVRIETGDVQIVETDAGTLLEVAGLGHLNGPGGPRLPAMRVLLGLPPGVRATSVEVLDVETTAVSEVGEIAPVSPIVLAADRSGSGPAAERLREEWRQTRRDVYGSDGAYPEKLAWITGRGRFHAIPYAAITVCPITIHPRSGRVAHHPRIELAVRFERQGAVRNSRVGAESRRVDPPVMDEASRLFANFAQIAPHYEESVENARGRYANRDETSDFVIVTTTGAVDAVEASGFIPWKTELGFRVRTVLTTDSEIAGQPGPDLAAKIRAFLRSVHAEWGIEYVLFVGGHEAVPMRVCYPDPDNHVYDPWNPGLVAPGTPTDSYYADLSDPDAVSWDADGDGYPGEYGEDEPDFLAEVSVGRIPVDDPDRITYTLDKMVSFEQDPGDWKRNALQGGAILFFENQNHGDYPFIDGATCLDSIETGLLSDWSVTRFSEQAGIVKSSFDWPALTEPSFTVYWGLGAYGVVNWSGHGWCDGAYRTVWAWDDGDGVPESGIGELQSHRFIGTGAANLHDTHPSIVFAISCNVGYPEENPYGNLGIDLLTLPGWGPSAGIVSSVRPAAISADWKNDPGGTEQICFDFNRCLVAEGDRVGDALYNGKFHATTYYGWDRVYEYMNLYNFNLYGDPSLVVGAHTVDAPEAVLSRGPRISLDPIRPNPFARDASVRLGLRSAGPVRITVHDVSGRRVAVLVEGRLEAGTRVVSWDGTGLDGERMPSGTYFIVADGLARSASRKVVLLD